MRTPNMRLPPIRRTGLVIYFLCLLLSIGNHNGGASVAAETTGHEPAASSSSSSNSNSNDIAVAPPRKTLPSIYPRAKKVLFVAHFWTGTDVNQMLDIADELKSRDRDHECYFVVMEPYVKRVKQRGYHATPTPDIFKHEDPETLEYIQSFLPTDRGWWRYVNKFVHASIPVVVKYYEPSLVILEDWISQHGKPDLMMISKASESAADVGWKHGIPMAVLFSSPLGSMAHYYEDAIGAPDSFYWSRLDQQTRLLTRMQKVIGKYLVLFHYNTIAAAIQFCYIRYKHGMEIIVLAGGHWSKAAVISSWSMGLDIARKLRPLTFVVGFITDNPYLQLYNENDNNNLASSSATTMPSTLTAATPTPSSPTTTTSSSSPQLSKADAKHVQYLDSKPDGVVFCAFGSLARIHQEWFDEMVEGMDKWVRHQHSSSNTNNSTKDTKWTAGAVFAVNDLSISGGLDVKTNVPDTVTITNWANQKLFLAHPNTKVFFNHGGLGSLGEAIHAQVPMLVFPINFDQMNNAYRLVEAGVAESIHFREEKLTGDAVARKLIELSANEEHYRANLQKQYRISARSGGVRKAADIMEDMLVYGNLDHLIPIEERLPFPANCNWDLYALVMGVLGAGVYFVVQSWVLPYYENRKNGSGAGVEKIAPNKKNA